MHVLLSLISSDPDMPLPPLQTDCWDQQPHSSSASEPKGQTRAVRSLVRKGWDLLSPPPGSAEMARLGRDASAVVQELMLSSPDTDTALRGQSQRGQARCLVGAASSSGHQGCGQPPVRYGQRCAAHICDRCPSPLPPRPRGTWAIGLESCCCPGPWMSPDGSTASAS
jgi:hypothetical protein